MTNASFDFDVIKKYILQAKKMALYIGISNIDEIYDRVFEENLSVDTIIRTKCGLQVDCLEVLLDFSDSKTVFDNYYFKNNDLSNDFNKKYAYIITMQGMNTKKYNNNNLLCYTDVDHIFILINYNNTWHIMDSYICQRELTDKIVSIEELSHFIYKQRINFCLVQWNEFFNIDSLEENTKSVHSVINQYNYTMTIEENYSQLKEKYYFCLENSKDRIFDPNLLVLE